MNLVDVLEQLRAGEHDGRILVAIRTLVAQKQLAAGIAGVGTQVAHELLTLDAGLAFEHICHGVGSLRLILLNGKNLNSMILPI